jgi:DNA ligase D-like protein (predicted ligase)
VSSKLHFIAPQLATLVDKPPRREGWIHEVKHDGYRTLLLIEKGDVRACTRNGFDWSHRYPGIVREAAKLKCRSAILDGEVIVQDANGNSDFEHLSSVIRWAPERLIFYAFDLLHLNGKDLRDAPLLERRVMLKELLPPDDTRPLQFSEEFTGDVAAFFQACADRQLEGMVSKLASSKYRSGRSKTWLKTKCFTESSLIIIGTDRDRKTGALRAVLAREDGDGLAYVGAAFIALNREERANLQSRLERIKVKQSVAAIARCKLGRADASCPRSPSGWGAISETCDGQRSSLTEAGGRAHH